MRSVVVAAGCAFPSGPTVALADIALRTSLCLTIRHPFFVDACGIPVKGILCRAQPAAQRRWLELADAAMRDLASHLPAPIWAAIERSPIPLWLVLSASERPGRPESLETSLTEILARHWPMLHIVRGGHAACAQAIAAARAWIDEHGTPACVLAVDSAWPAETLSWLEYRGLLHAAHEPYNGQSRANPYGRVPGEGSAAFMLAPRGLYPAWCELAGIGQADETLTFDTDGPCVGAGLSAAAHAALGEAGLTPQAISTIVHDFNGEPYRADEFGFTALRLADHLADGWQRLTPALASGDLMSASLATHLAIAAWRMHQAGPAHAGPTLLLASNDDSPRAALVLTAPESR
ncbi:hypothetical protein ACNQFN_11105 [Thauera butanivorans]|uniref:hypothetical protein n=1 Tax=Thauera butanivorans TaxID=86174 RepID=UPI003AB65D72